MHPEAVGEQWRHYVSSGSHPPLSPYDTTRKGTAQILSVEKEAKGNNDQTTENKSTPVSPSSSSSSLFEHRSIRDSDWPILFTPEPEEANQPNETDKLEEQDQRYRI